MEKTPVTNSRNSTCENPNFKPPWRLEPVLVGEKESRLAGQFAMRRFSCSRPQVSVSQCDLLQSSLEAIVVIDEALVTCSNYLHSPSYYIFHLCYICVTESPVQLSVNLCDLRSSAATGGQSLWPWPPLPCPLDQAVSELFPWCVENDGWVCHFPCQRPPCLRGG